MEYIDNVMILDIVQSVWCGIKGTSRQAGRQASRDIGQEWDSDDQDQDSVTESTE